MSRCEDPTRCSVCEASSVTSFYRQTDVPVHSVLLLRDRAAAESFPTGTIDLGICGTCGFISNLAFDPSLLTYGADYDGTQSFSSTFDGFHRQLAGELVARCQLQGKTILEVGCGRGDFLALLCELGDNRGIGFDPTAVAADAAPGRLRIVRDFFPNGADGLHADLVCCKMTLEHTP